MLSIYLHKQIPYFVSFFLKLLIFFVTITSYKWYFEPIVKIRKWLRLFFQLKLFTLKIKFNFKGKGKCWMVLLQFEFLIKFVNWCIDFFVKHLGTQEKELYFKECFLAVRWKGHFHGYLEISILWWFVVQFWAFAGRSWL